MENQENENKEVLAGEVVENSLVETEVKNTITSFTGRKRNTNTACQTITNIHDNKLLYNLSASVDCKINDCVGEKIRVKGIVINFYDKELKEPKIIEETGEIIEIERSVSCILVDDSGKSYATGSKTFAWQLINLIDRGYTSEEEISENGLEIEIIKKDIAGSNNKALGFKLV